VWCLRVFTDCTVNTLMSMVFCFVSNTCMSWVNFYTGSVPWLNGNLALAEKCSGPLRFRLRQVLLYYTINFIFASKKPTFVLRRLWGLFEFISRFLQMLINLRSFHYVSYIPTVTTKNYNPHAHRQPKEFSDLWCCIALSL